MGLRGRASSAAVVQVALLLLSSASTCSASRMILIAHVRRPARRAARPPDEPRLPAHLVPVAPTPMPDVETLVDALHGPPPAARDRGERGVVARQHRRSPTSTSDAGSSTDIALRDALGDVRHVRRGPRRARSDPADAGRRPARPPPARGALRPDAPAPGPGRPAGRSSSSSKPRSTRPSTRSAARSTATPVDDNTISQILRTSDDSDERRRGVGSVEAGGRRGRRAGAASSPASATAPRSTSATATTSRSRSATSELDETRLFATLDEVEAATAAPFADVEGRARRGARGPLRRRRSTSSRPWHYDDPFFQDPPAAGAVDLDAWLEPRRPRGADRPHLRRASASTSAASSSAATSLPRAGKSQHAFCIDVDHEGDVRVLSNNMPVRVLDRDDAARVRPRALRPRQVDPDLPWLLRDDAPAHDRGHRDAVRPARPRRRVARRGRRRRRRRPRGAGAAARRSPGAPTC